MKALLCRFPTRRQLKTSGHGTFIPRQTPPRANALTDSLDNQTYLINTSPRVLGVPTCLRAANQRNEYMGFHRCILMLPRPGGYETARLDRWKYFHSRGCLTDIVTLAGLLTCLPAIPQERCTATRSAVPTATLRSTTPKRSSVRTTPARSRSAARRSAHTTPARTAARP